MNSLNKSVDTPATRSADQPLIADGGVPYSPASNRDPFEVLDDLMCVVEALTPVWPPREPMKEGKYWLL